MIPQVASALGNFTQRVLEQALSPAEWKEIPSVADKSDSSRAAASALVERWKKLVILRGKSIKAFESRVATLKLSGEEAETRLLRRTIKGDFAAPKWAIFLDQVLAFPEAESSMALEFMAAETTEECHAHDLSRHGNLVFPGLVAPFLAGYLSALRETSSTLFSPRAQASLLRSLLRQLSTLCARTVTYELKAAQRRGELRGQTPEDRYADYVQGRLRSVEGRTQLLANYPVLARLLATVTLNQISATRDVFCRLDSDYDNIRTVLCNGVAPGMVALCFTGLSDPHDGGGSAWQLRFEDGSSIMYKPRSHQIDAIYGELLQWLNARGAEPPLRAARLIAKDGYGWTELIVARECVSEAEVERYYRRQGAHTALIYFLCGRDFHAENFIADGETPVAVDLEGLLAPAIAVPQGDFATASLGVRFLQFSAAMSLMLPYWRAGDYEQGLFQASGIGGSGDRKWPVKGPVWKGIGTDSLTLEHEFRHFEFDSSVPRLRGVKASAYCYLTAVEEGFTAAYKLWMEHRDELLSAHGPLEPLRGVASRFLFRDSQEYANLLFWTTAPDILKSGGAYDVALEVLAGSIPVFFNGSSFPEIVEEEKRALWQRDIPIAFSSTVATGLFFSSGTSFGPVIPQPIIEQMKRRISDTSHADLEWQRGLIRSLIAMAAPSLVSSQVGQLSGLSSLKSGPQASSTVWTSTTAEQRILACAYSIGEDLDRIALRYGNSTDWLTLVRIARGAAYINPAQLDPWSLNGASGAALFLINLSKATGDKRFEVIGRQALASALRIHDETARGPLGSFISISGYLGSFALVYALAASAQQTGDEELERQALDLALRHPLERLAAETNPDFLTGAAGALSILCDLFRRTGDGRLLDAARTLGSVIARSAVNSGRQGWLVPGFRRPLLGMAHGSAGIAVALLKLFRETGEPNWRDMALAGLAHERDHFQSTDGAWPNLQDEENSSYMTGWCAGAPGIGLSRLVVRSIIPSDAESANEINLAVASTCRNLGGVQHHICCGEAGRLLFLAAASESLGRPDLRSEALDSALRMLDQFEQRGLWHLQDFSEKLTIPGLLSGVPGIGMGLLALVSPTTSKVGLLS